MGLFSSFLPFTGRKRRGNRASGRKASLMGSKQMQRCRREICPQKKNLSLGFDSARSHLPSFPSQQGIICCVGPPPCPPLCVPPRPQALAALRLFAWSRAGTGRSHALFIFPFNSFCLFPKSLPRGGTGGGKLLRAAAPTTQPSERRARNTGVRLPE